MKNTATKPASNNSNQKEKVNSNVEKGLRNLFVDKLKSIYWIEKALVIAIPKMVKNATAPELGKALTAHLEVTKQHVTRLEEVFTTIGEKAEEKKCEVMEMLIKEAGKIMENTEEGVVRDAAIISAGQKVEHNEMASYHTLSALAKTLGETAAVNLLDETLSEEKEADEKLSEIAESVVKLGATNEDNHHEEEHEMSNSGGNTKERHK